MNLEEEKPKVNKTNEQLNTEMDELLDYCDSLKDELGRAQRIIDALIEPGCCTCNSKSPW